MGPYLAIVCVSFVHIWPLYVCHLSISGHCMCVMCPYLAIVCVSFVHIWPLYVCHLSISGHCMCVICPYLAIVCVSFVHKWPYVIHFSRVKKVSVPDQTVSTLGFSE